MTETDIYITLQGKAPELLQQPYLMMLFTSLADDNCKYFATWGNIINDHFNTDVNHEQNILYLQFL